MSRRALYALRVVVVVTVVAILGLGIALVQAFVTPGGGAPRTAAERTILSAEEAVRANPDDPVARVRLAAAYLEQGSTGMAKEQAELALRINPEMPDAHFVLGVALYRTGESEAAVASLTTAGETEGQFAPFYQEVYIALAGAHEATGDTDAAIEALNTAMTYGPQNARVYVERGLLFERAENWYEAAADFAYALIFVSDYQEAIDGLARIEQSHPEEHAKAVKDVDALRTQLVPHSESTKTAE